MVRVEAAEVLEMMAFGADKITRPTFRNLLAGFEEFEHRPKNERWLEHLRARQWVKKSGRGHWAVYQLTEAGRRHAQRDNPTREWDRPWDGSWRVVMFDLPETRRAERYQLWQALRARRLGMLQRSVWVWPHDLRAILAEIIRAEGVPECFCGFTARELFLCKHDELVQTAWPWEEIEQRQRSYLRHPMLTKREITRVGDLAGWARLARAERNSYAEAFVFDPLLPRQLLPKGYLGVSVHDLSEQRRAQLSARARQLAIEVV
jgi:phenylacetic acid degradation operon negative regulatory protein